MTPMRHRLSADAVADIRRLYRKSVTQFGLAHADRYVARLENAFRAIAEFPNAYPERSQINGARIKPYEAHHILYRVRTDEVVILRVLHGRQDLKRYLPD